MAWQIPYYFLPFLRVSSYETWRKIPILKKGNKNVTSKKDPKKKEALSNLQMQDLRAINDSLFLPKYD